MAVDAERVGQRQRDLAPGRVRVPRGHPERFLGAGRIEQVALEIEDAGAGDHLRIDVLGPRCADAPRNVLSVRCASGVTRMRQRPVAGPVAGRENVVAHAGRAEIVTEHVAELIVAHLADVLRRGRRTTPRRRSCWPPSRRRSRSAAPIAS